MEKQSELISFLNWEDESSELGYIGEIIESPAGIWGFRDGIA